ncbi:MAG: AtpZ/AtpI family protein [Putridiphycobacter sp.]
MSTSDHEPKKSAYLKYSSLGFQMAITIGLGAWLGTYLDDKYKTETPVYTIVCILVSIAIALYQIIKEVINLSKEEDKKKSHHEQKSTQKRP